MKIWTKVREKLQEQGKTVRQLEKATGVSKDSIYRWDYYSPRVNNLKLVADELGCTLDELVSE